MILLGLLIGSLVLQNTLALNPNYRECINDDECYSDYDPKDPRTQVLDLYGEIWGKMVDSAPMPDFKIYAFFNGGILNIYYEDSGDSSCVCPLTKKCDATYAVFHDDMLLSVNYNWTIPWSPYTNYTLTGDVDISAQIFYNAYFINEINGGPSIDRINITSFDIFSWYIEGQPLEMLEKLPDELFKKTMVVVLKQIIEDKLTALYNNAIQDMNEGRSPIRRNTLKKGQKNRIKLLNILKPRRKISNKRSRYFNYQQ